MRILVMDVGGTHVKVLTTGHKQRVEFPFGPEMTSANLTLTTGAPLWPFWVAWTTRK